MIIIQNKWINKIIPFPSFRACNLWGILFVRGERPLTEITINHEKIHTAQIIEVTLAATPILFVIALLLKTWILLSLVLVFYYLWYVVEWILRLFKGNAYRSISFEREAYAHQGDLSYLKSRKAFSFIKYLKRDEA